MSSCRRRKGPSKARLDDKTVVITGANTGIGKETVRDLFKRGARVILACRDQGKAQEVAEEIRMEVPSRPEYVIVKTLDLSSMSSIRSFAVEILEEEPKIHILINNAGVMMCPQWKTEDGFEMQMGTNHLGHFLLTNLLLERLKASAPARVITVAARIHSRGKINFDDLMLEKKYGPIDAYANSKLANILFTRELARRLKGTGVNAYVVNPGSVKTNLQRHVPWLIEKALNPFLKTPVQGAQNIIYCAVNEELKDQSGLYYSDFVPAEPASRGKDNEVALRLWNVSCDLVKIEKDHEAPSATVTE